MVGDTFGIHKTTVCRIIHSVSQAIASLRKKYIAFTATQEERLQVMNNFYANSGMPGTIGAVDCTHILIQSPGGDDAEIYRNRKGYFSVNVQMIADYSLTITDVVARWPGSGPYSTTAIYGLSSK